MIKFKKSPASDFDDDDVQRFNVHLKSWLAHNTKVNSDMLEKNEKQLESVESVRWVER